jgi:predicted nucleic acid-binding protein
LALAYGLTAYDAAYLDLAMRLGATLATLDAALIRAAASCAVPLVHVGR